MSILIVSELFYPTLRGGEVVLWRLAQALVRHGHRVQVVTSRPDGTAAHEVIDGIEIFRPLKLTSAGRSDSLRTAAEKVAFMVRLYQYLARWMEGFQPDVIYNNAYTVTLPCGRLGRKHGIPVVTNVGNLQGNAHLAGARWSPLGWLQQAKERIVLQMGGHCAVRVASDAIAQQVRSMTSAEVHVIPSPIDDQAARAVMKNLDSSAIRAEFDAGEDDLLLLFVGALESVKNLDGLLSVLANIRRSFKLLIVGRGREESRLRAHVEAERMSNRVVFVGEQPGYRVMELMAAADVLLLASRSENLPTVVLEALSLGTSVISTDVGGVKEISSLNLIVVESVEDIGHLVENGISVHDDWGVLERYSTDAIAGQFERMFERVIAQSTRAMTRQ